MVESCDIPWFDHADLLKNHNKVVIYIYIAYIYIYTHIYIHMLGHIKTLLTVVHKSKIFR